MKTRSKVTMGAFVTFERILTVFHEFWRDTRGSAAVASTILVTTIVSIGALVGLVTVRDHVLQQFGDVAVGLDLLDQSYRYDVGVDGNGDGDLSDPEDCRLQGSFSDTSSLTDPAGDAPAGLDLTILPTDEG